MFFCNINTIYKKLNKKYIFCYVSGKKIYNHRDPMRLYSKVKLNN